MAREGETCHNDRPGRRRGRRMESEENMCALARPATMTGRASAMMSRGFFLLQRCLGKSRAVRPSVSKAKGTTGMYNGPLNKLSR